jgi:quercetin dioxygenase-like cupin family protein
MNTFKRASVAAGLAAMAGGIAWAADQVNAGPDGKDFVRTTPDTVHWVDYPGDGAQFGIKEAFLLGDPTKPGLYVIRIKFPAGVMSSPHSHPEMRIGTVIQGTWWTGIGEKFDPASATPIPAGGMMIHPAGKVHYDGARNEEAIVQMMGIGPTGKTTATPGAPGFMKVPR